MHDIFCFTDVHGNYKLYKAVMDYCFSQDPECSIVYCGDACDRGPSGYKIMKELLNNPYVIYLKGNHEDMFVRATRFILRDYNGKLNEKEIDNYLYKCYTEDFYSAEVQLSIYNGGMNTLKDWMLNGMSVNFVDKINKLPLTISTETCDFCHAGGDPKAFLRASTCEYNEEFVDLDDQQMLLWDRNWLGFGWIPSRTLVYGHTPTYHLAAKYYGQDKSYANAHPCAYTSMMDDKRTGRKINMDCGTANSNRLFVLNVLTMEAQGFENKQNVVKRIGMIKF